MVFRIRERACESNSVETNIDKQSKRLRFKKLKNFLTKHFSSVDISTTLKSFQSFIIVQMTLQMLFDSFWVVIAFSGMF